MERFSPTSSIDRGKFPDFPRRNGYDAGMSRETMHRPRTTAPNRAFRPAQPEFSARFASRDHSPATNQLIVDAARARELVRGQSSCTAGICAWPEAAFAAYVHQKALEVEAEARALISNLRAQAQNPRPA